MSRVLFAFLVGWLLIPLRGQNTHEVKGTVVDSETGEPIPHARVFAMLRILDLPTSNSSTMSVLTDADGKFEIRNIPYGQLDLTASKAGYLLGPLARAVTNANPSLFLRSPAPPMPPNKAVVDLADGKPSLPVILRLTREAVITGTITDERGQALWASIAVYADTPEKSSRLQNPQFVDRTGEFRIAGLPAGRYYLEVGNAWNGVTAPGQKNYATRFYPDKTDLQSAKPIEVTAGQQVHVEMSLVTVSGFEIRGQFRASERPHFWLQSWEGPFEWQRISITETWDSQTGSFKLSGVPSGSYYLHADSNLTGPMIDLLRIKVDGADVDGIVLTPRTR
jgi:hypothetical protein